MLDDRSDSLRPLPESDVDVLILNRRVGEAIQLDGGIRLVVLANDGNRVRLGIDAPASVAIVREELVQTIAEENRRAQHISGATEWLQDLEAEDEEPGAGRSA